MWAALVEGAKIATFTLGLFLLLIGAMVACAEWQTGIPWVTARRDGGWLFVGAVCAAGLGVACMVWALS